MSPGGQDERGGQPIFVRERVEARCKASTVVVLEAPGGFGKSTLAESLTAHTRHVVRVFVSTQIATPTRLASALRAACRATGLAAVAEVGSDYTDARGQITELAGALVRMAPEGACLVIEDAHHLDALALDALLAMVAAVTPRLRVVVCGRSVPITFPGEVRLGAAELAFTADETATLMAVAGVDDDFASSITVRCAGWPAAIGLTVAAAERGQAIAASSAQLESLLGALLDEFEPLDDRVLAALAQLPILSDEIARAIGAPDLVPATLAAGLPLRNVGGWWRLSDPVRDALAPRSRLPVADLAAAAEVMFASGETMAAVDVLIADDRYDAMCALIARADYGELDQLEVDQLVALLDAAPDGVVEDNPGCLIQLARAADSRVRIELRARLLNRLAAVGSEQLGARLSRELEAELVCDLSRDSLVDEAVRRGEALMQLVAPDELVTRARCLRAMGRALAWRGDARSLVDASHVLAEAAGAARAVGNAAWRADALCVLGYSVHFARGEFELALQRLTEGSDLLGRESRHRAVQLTFLVEVLALLGRDEEALAALAEARWIGRLHGDERILGYAAWSQAKVVARSRDVDATLRWLRQAELHPGDWMDHPTGSLFLADAADLAAAVGAEQVATDYLARATAHASEQGWPEIVEIARGTLAARFGDPMVAEQLLVPSETNAHVNTANEWRVQLIVAHARLRRGDVDGARALAAIVMEQLGRLGHPEFAMLHEPEIWPNLEQLVTGHRPPRVEVQVLGRFRVSVDGSEVIVPSGRPAQLVKIVAVSGSPVPVDELVEQLWPDSPPDIGRRRLRNVLTRVRALAPIVDRSDDRDVVAMAPGVDVDARAFEHAVRQTISATREQQRDLARQGMAMYVGDLLPADRADDWTVAPRERLQRRAVRLLGILVDAAEADGDVDAAIDGLDAMLQMEPFDDSLALRAASILLASGERARAASWAATAAAIRVELGLDVPAEPLMLLEPG
ncbi:MAG: hypothetical protein JWM34_3932 [Ilumatobacteraceae bacterium]|nr:hypothetical protein [Ilumatobacteraceae bacterium]